MFTEIDKTRFNVNNSEHNSPLSLYFSAYIQLSGENTNMKLYDMCKVISELETIPAILGVNLSWNGAACNNSNIILGYKILNNNSYKTTYSGPASEIRYLKYAVPYINKISIEWDYECAEDYVKRTKKHISNYFKLINNINELYRLAKYYNKDFYLLINRDTPRIRLEIMKLMYDDIVFPNADIVDIKCPELFNAIYIDIDLNVKMCEKSDYIIGNLREEKLRNILEKIDLIDIKEQHLRGIVPAECTKCLKHLIQGEEC